ncbi:MAG TPA: SseB family protein [Actinomycetes bacterium]|nr:SseB family protein [Actinomycetes bacterium]
MVDPLMPGKPLSTSSFADDDGSASADLGDALTAYALGTDSALSVLRALASGRVLVPVVAVLEELEELEVPEANLSTADRTPLAREKQSSMATVLIEQPNGQRALLAFTSLKSMQAWRADARPVPVTGARAAQSAIAEDASSLLVDIAGPTPFAVTGDELARLAAGVPVEPAEQLESLRREVGELLGRPNGLVDARLEVADPSTRLVLVVDSGLEAEAYRTLMSFITGQLAGSEQLRRELPGGLSVIVVAPDVDLGDTPSVIHHP